jgi:ankyrin repeat protein
MKKSAICIVVAMSVCWWVVPSAIAQSSLVDDPFFWFVQAVSGNKTNELRKFIAEGVDVNQHFGAASETALFRAKRADVAQILLDAGAVVSATNNFGATAFQYAAVNGHRDVAELLLRKGAHLDMRDALGRTALHMAAKAGGKNREDLALWLLEMGADPNVVAKDGKETVLFNAQSSGKSKLVRALLGRGVKVAGTDKQGMSPLHMAVMFGDTNAISVLIEGGSAIDSTDENGVTPLLFCMMLPLPGYDQLPIVDLLVTAGADIEKRDKRGRSALDLAKQMLQKAETETRGTPEARAANVSEAKALLGRIEGGRGKSKAPIKTEGNGDFLGK